MKQQKTIEMATTTTIKPTQMRCLRLNKDQQKCVAIVLSEAVMRSHEGQEEQRHRQQN